LDPSLHREAVELIEEPIELHREAVELIKEPIELHREAVVLLAEAAEVHACISLAASRSNRTASRSD
jgi:hypothetical protein